MLKSKTQITETKQNDETADDGGQVADGVELSQSLCRSDPPVPVPSRWLKPMAYRDAHPDCK